MAGMSISSRQQPVARQVVGHLCDRGLQQLDGLIPIAVVESDLTPAPLNPFLRCAQVRRFADGLLSPRDVAHEDVADRLLLLLLKLFLTCLGLSRDAV